MARGKAKEKTKATNNYKEYDITGAHQNDFTGRLYLDGTESDKGTWYGLGITINSITIKGAKLWVPKDGNKDCSIMWPGYKDKDGKYNPYILVLGEDDRSDLTDLANKLAELIG